MKGGIGEKIGITRMVRITGLAGRKGDTLRGGKVGWMETGNASTEESKALSVTGSMK